MNENITIRDCFAAAALQGFLASLSKDSYVSPTDIAQHAYSLADSMIKEREKQNENI